MTFLLFLHILAAIFLVGPLTVVTMTAPRAIRMGPDGLPLLRWLSRSTRVYGLGALVVGLLGAGLVPGDYDWGQFWLSSSVSLFVVALGLVFGLIDRDIRHAVRRLEAGEAASVKQDRVLGVSVVVSLLWLGILLLMVYKPGA